MSTKVGRVILRTNYLQHIENKNLRQNWSLLFFFLKNCLRPMILCETFNCAVVSKWDFSNKRKLHGGMFCGVLFFYSQAAPLRLKRFLAVVVAVQNFLCACARLWKFELCFLPQKVLCSSTRKCIARRRRWTIEKIAENFTVEHVKGVYSGKSKAKQIQSCRKTNKIIFNC